MHSTINVCFMCITEKNCRDVNDSLLILVEYILPEVTIIKLNVNLRICAVCEETICLFSKFKGVCVENSILLETAIKDAHSYKKRGGKTNEDNSTTSKTNDGSVSDSSQPGGSKDGINLREDDEKNSTKRYYCQICKMGFKHAYRVQRHMKLVHYTKEHKCHLCEAEFARRYDYNQHLLIVHAKIKRICCTKCGTRVARHRDLTRHNRLVHSITTQPKKKDNKTREKKYKCNDCNRTFWQRSNLASHVKVHDEKTKIKCKICLGSYTQAGYFFHRQKHENEAKIKCAECGEPVSHNIHLKWHPNYRHEAKIKKKEHKRVDCPECKKSLQEPYLKEHLKRHQKVEGK